MHYRISLKMFSSNGRLDFKYMDIKVGFLYESGILHLNVKTRNEGEGKEVENKLQYALLEVQ